MELLERISRYLNDQRLKLATAESCTAGLIVSELARIPGSGQSIDCGLAVYSPEAKNRYLAVRFETIDKYGLTSEETSREMALGLLKRDDITLAIANTGIAGPEQHDGIPVGTVCFAWAFRHRHEIFLYTETQRFDGARNDVRIAAAHYALERIPAYHANLLEGKTPLA